MATKRWAIREALVTLLEGISGIETVSRRYVQPRNIDSFVNAQVLFDSDRQEAGALHRKTGNLRLIVLLWAKDTATQTADEILDGLVETIADTIELHTSGAAFLGLGYVEDVFVEDAEPFTQGEEEVVRDMACWAIRAVVRYMYTRGES